jgi:DNA-directed RNA polymerase specialized sigma24 family protein
MSKSSPNSVTHWIDRFKDPRLESVAVAKMEGYSNREIGTRIGCAPRSVERKLATIRSIWKKEIVR